MDWLTANDAVNRRVKRLRQGFTMWHFVRRSVGAMSAALLLLLATGSALVVSGCRVDKVAFNRYQEGKKFLAADQPFQAIEYFEESLKRSSEKETAPAARAYILVSLARAADKVGPTHPDFAKYTSQRGPALESVRNDPVALKALVELLANHDQSSQSAVNLCVELGAAIAPMLLDGYAQNAQVRNDVPAILEQIGAPAAPEIAKSAQSAALAPELRIPLVRLLGGLGGDEAQQALAALSKDPSRGIQIEAASALYRAGDTSQRDTIFAALDDPDIEARRSAANAIIYFNEAPDAKLLVSHLKDADAAVRKALVLALGKHASNGVGATALIRVIQKDPDTDVANEAIRALAAHGASIVPTVLDALVSERDWPRRQRFIQVLKDPNVKAGFTQDLEYKLYEFYEKRETEASLKSELAQLLKSLEK